MIRWERHPRLRGAALRAIANCIARLERIVAWSDRRQNGW